MKQTTEQTLQIVRKGFTTLPVDEGVKEAALTGIQKRLTEDTYYKYISSIQHLVRNKERDLLVDCFYRTIPFGTGGRRGKVGIGPNRINEATLMESAQGHSEYLKSSYPETYKSGLAIAYDVRVYTGKEFGEDSPVSGLGGKYLAEKISGVYAAHDIKVFLFDGVASTPELAYLVRSLGLVSGIVISASHNPPEYNGKKVYNETGCQLIPPFDEHLITYVGNITEVISLPFEEALSSGKVRYITQDERKKYISYVTSMSLSSSRSAVVYFSPLHGTTFTSVYPVLQQAGFNVIMDPITGVVDPTFSSVIFNIPDPEVVKVYDGLLAPADEAHSDIILTTDPDGDRIGCMSKEGERRHFFNGNEIAILCSAYLLEQRSQAGTLTGEHLITKTMVTSDLLYDLARHYNVSIIGDLLVGFKYIGNEVNKLAEQGKEELFLLGVEESHGISVGSMRDKGSACAALLLSELASTCKDQGSTLLQYLEGLYSQFGYFHNYLTEIRLPGAEGMEQIQRIMESFRTAPPLEIGGYIIAKMTDMQSGKPFLSESDKKSRNVLHIEIKGDDTIKTISCVVRPSGTEPKIKFYFQVGGYPQEKEQLSLEIENCQRCVELLEKALLGEAYTRIGIDFPERGFLLFNKMPLDKKLHYFDIEEQIAELKNSSSSEEKEKQLDELLSAFGSNPIEKIEKAFEARYGMGIREWIGV